MRRKLSVVWLLGLGLLSACRSGQSGGGASAGSYVGGSVPVDCAPFARALSGVRLTGAAADWWDEAGSRYRRSNTPAEGSVLVFRRSGRLPSGHVSVVSRVLSSRSILVTQANWVHHRVSQDQPVIDLSAGNDWTLVRVWWPPSDQMGNGEYATYGFISPDRPIRHDQLLANTTVAIRVATNP